MYYFIVNPNARRGMGEKIWMKLERHMHQLGVEYQAYLTSGQGDAKGLASKLTEKISTPRTIVVVGGDGTVNEVLDGLSFDCPFTLGYIPTGSGNDLARSLRLPKNPRKCLKRILNPRGYAYLDYGILSYEKNEPVHRRFAVSSGIGMDAAVCHNLLDANRIFMQNPSLRKKGNRRTQYILCGIKQLFSAKPVKGSLVLDGIKKIEFNHIYFISAHIHPSEGGGFKFAPKANYADGLLDICVVHTPHKTNMIPILADALFGRLGKHRGVRFYQCNEVAIHVDRPMAVHVDGESCLCQTDIHLRCVGKKLKMIV